MYNVTMLGVILVTVIIVLTNWYKVCTTKLLCDNNIIQYKITRARALKKNHVFLLLACTRHE